MTTPFTPGDILMTVFGTERDPNEKADEIWVGLVISDEETIRGKIQEQAVFWACDGTPHGIVPYEVASLRAMSTVVGNLYNNFGIRMTDQLREELHLRSG